MLKFYPASRIAANKCQTLHHSGRRKKSCTKDRAKFIREETGGAYEGDTSGLNATIILQNSRVRVCVQRNGYVNAVRPGPKGRGTLPDIEIARKTEETLRGVDTALDRAIQTARAP